MLFDIFLTLEKLQAYTSYIYLVSLVTELPTQL